MKFGTALVDDQPVAVMRGSDGLARRLDSALSKVGCRAIDSVREFVRLFAKGRFADESLQEAADSIEGFEPERWSAPLPDPTKILGVAFNNRELMRKAHRDPGVPNFFLKPPSCLQGHRGPIVVDPAWGAVIPEPEVCAVMGRRMKRVSEEAALDGVFGYTIHNDVTSHGLKFGKDSIAVTYDRDMARPEFYGWRNLRGEDDRDAFFVYHTRSKGTDTFGPMGPWITTSDEIPDPDNLDITGTLNGEVFTIDNTRN